MAIEVFNRYENKYIIDLKTFYELEKRLLNYMNVDLYNKQGKTYKIANIYYDSDDNYLIRTCLQKPEYREKLRIRSYETTPDKETMVYVEIKKKVFGLVNKRRTKIKLADSYDFLETGEIKNIEPYMNKQVINEIKYLFEQYKPKPKTYLSYDRKAYFEKDNDNLRISFDTNIISRHTDLLLEHGSYGQRLIDENKCLMEVKTLNSLPLWLVQIISEYNMLPVSFSKYGTDYKNSLKGGEQKCLIQFSKQQQLEQQLQLAIS